MSQPLLIVDVQVGFINSFTHHIPQRIVSLIERDRYSPLLFTRFVNAPDGPYDRFLNWHSCDREPETDLVPELQPLLNRNSSFPSWDYAGCRIS